MPTPGRTALLRRVAAAVQRHRGAFDAALVAQRAYPISSIHRDRAALLRDVQAAQERADPLRGREALDGEVLCVVPYNLGYWALIPVLNCLAPGNRVRLRLPRDGERVRETFVAMVEDIAGPGRVLVDQRPGRDLATWAATDPACAAVCFYGSDGAADSYRPAADAGPPVLVEGPGNDPVIVLPDAPPQLAGWLAARKVAFGSGQACFAPERVLVHADRYGSFVEDLVAAFAQLRVGQPEDPRTDVGPILHAGVRRRLAAQLDDAQQRGAELVIGGISGDTVLPTVVAGLTTALRVTTEEVFGPVAYVGAFTDEEEAVAMACASPYGLGSTVWGDAGARRLADRLRGAEYLEEVPDLVYGRFGVVTVNEHPLGNSLHEPFGGYGRSGWVWRRLDGRVRTFQGPKLAARELSHSMNSAQTGRP
ncbi:MAG: aldehyde dehydrogenase family protein [Pseudonocardiaceae bacterium]|nr:aldehyde dehydrogenase family protein [Pseudonocardiaceae bacterium]